MKPVHGGSRLDDRDPGDRARQRSQGGVNIGQESVKTASGHIVVFGPFRLDRRSTELRRDGELVALPGRAAALLTYLVNHAGELVTKEALVEAAWPDTAVSDASLKEAIHVLRQALGDAPQSPAYIQTVPRRGYRFVGDLAEESSGDRSTARRPWRLAALLATLLIAVLGFRFYPWPAPPSPARTVRFDLRMPEGVTLTPGPANLALSADGQSLAIVAKELESPRRLFLRRIDQVDVRPISDTENATAPFFSHDGRWLGYFTDEALYKVSTSDGSPRKLADVSDGVAGSWGDSGDIVFCALASPSGAGLWQLIEGGRPRILTSLAPGEIAHRWPHHIPGGRWLTFTIQTAAAPHLELLDLTTSARTSLVVGASNPSYADGKLVYARGGALEAAPFDAATGRLDSVTVSALEGVLRSPIFGTAHFALSASGTLAYLGDSGSGATALGHRRGAELEMISLQARDYVDLRGSPSGDRLALVIRGPEGFDLWLLTTSTSTLSRLTFDGSSLGPVWSPDGRSLAYVSKHADGYALYRRPADGSGQAEVLLTTPEIMVPTSWNANGLIYSRKAPAGDWDVWRLELEAGDSDRPLLDGRFDEQRATVSPGGRYLAYESNESGRFEIFLRPFPELDDRKWQLSANGGTRPLWSPDGQHLFFRRGGQVNVVEMAPAPASQASVPLFETADIMGNSLSVVEGGYVVVEPSGRSSFDRVRIVIDWLTEIDER